MLRQRELGSSTPGSSEVCVDLISEAVYFRSKVQQDPLVEMPRSPSKIRISCPKLGHMSHISSILILDSCVHVWGQGTMAFPQQGMWVFDPKAWGIWPGPAMANWAWKARASLRQNGDLRAFFCGTTIFPAHNWRGACPVYRRPICRRPSRVFPSLRLTFLFIMSTLD